MCEPLHTKLNFVGGTALGFPGAGRLRIVHDPRGGLLYMHSSMYALQESVRQMRGPAQIPRAKASVCRGVGGMFAGSGTIIFSNEPP